MKHGSLISPDEPSFSFGRATAGFDLRQADAPGDFVTIPDADLLFNGAFKRVGDDLSITGRDGAHFVVEDYFRTDKRATLLSPEGAALTPAVVEALAGPLAPGQYAQAGSAPSANPPIGRVDKVEGNASVVRNGVTIVLNTGDVVLKGDVVQTGAGASLGIVFSDGTAFSLAANARMVLNDFVYSAGASNNSALISLVQGSISFVAGQVAKTGDMRVDTPVATMGIRGTAVLVEINANNGQTKFSVMVEPNGTVGSFNLYDKGTGALLATVNNSTIGWVVTPVGPLQVLAQQVQKTPAELAQELVVIQQVFQIFDQGQQNPFDPGQLPQQQPTDPSNRGDNTDPQNTQTAQGTTIIPSGTYTVTITPQGGGPGSNSNSGSSGNSGNSNSNTGSTGPIDTSDTPPPPITTTFSIINGTAGNDLLTGTAGDDWVYAGAGDDVIIAGHGGGNDFYDGGDGNDTIRFASTTTGVVVDLAAGTAIGAETGSDTLVNIENATGGDGDDTLTGNSGDNILIGRAGNDTIDGGAGNDTLYGDYAPIVYGPFGAEYVYETGQCGGGDILTGGAGDDTIDGSDGNDIAVYSGARSDYLICGNGTEDDPFIIVDLRDDSPDGTDTVYNVETLRFADGDLGTATPVAVADTDTVRESGVWFGNWPMPGDPIAIGNVLLNDTDTNEGDSLTVIGIARGDTGEGSDSGVGAFVFGTYGFLVMFAGGGYRYTLNNQDPDTQALARGEPAEDVFTYTVTDELGLTATTTLTIQITGTNDAPVIFGGQTFGTVIEEGTDFWGRPRGDATASGTLYKFDVDSDDDAGNDAWSIVPRFGQEANQDGTVNGRYGTLSIDDNGHWTYELDEEAADSLALGQTRFETFTVRVTDSHGANDTQTITVTVRGSNDAPVVANAIDDKQAAVNEEFSFQFADDTFSDIDSGSLVYSATLENGDPLPSWLSFDPQTRTFSGTPLEANTLSIRVTASDGFGSVSETFALTIEGPPEPTLFLQQTTTLSPFQGDDSGRDVAYSNGWLFGVFTTETGSYITAENAEHGGFQPYFFADTTLNAIAAHDKFVVAAGSSNGSAVLQLGVFDGGVFRPTDDVILGPDAEFDDVFTDGQSIFATGWITGNGPDLLVTRYQLSDGHIDGPGEEISFNTSADTYGHAIAYSEDTLYVAGMEYTPEGGMRATVWEISTAGNWVLERTFQAEAGYASRYLGIHLSGNDLYTVGVAGTPGPDSFDYLVTRWDIRGDEPYAVWSTTFDGGSDSDALHEITMFQGHLFAVGTNADTATLIELDPETGDVLQTLQNERGSGTDEYRGIATDDTHIYAGGTLGSDGTIDTYYYAPMVNDVLDFDDLTTSESVPDGYGAAPGFGGFNFWRFQQQPLVVDNSDDPDAPSQGVSLVSMTSTSIQSVDGTEFRLNDLSLSLAEGEQFTVFGFDGSGFGHVFDSGPLSSLSELDALLADAPAFTAVSIFTTGDAILDDFDFTTLPSLRGTTGADTLTALSYGARVIGGKGNDMLIAGDGADTFVFRTGDGQDAIVGFNPDFDVIELFGRDQNEDGVFDIDDLSIDTSGGSTVIQYGFGSQVTVQDITGLTPDHFMFHLQSGGVA
ncbi:MAG: hypothetical protein GHHEDOFH_00523 [Pseudorhodoplanes sp.]|nr:hypothetical protein [Pseudorhodoplanes sp.]